jgi:hypothetical protein
MQVIGLHRGLGRKRSVNRLRTYTKGSTNLRSAIVRPAQAALERSSNVPKIPWSTVKDNPVAEGDWNAKLTGFKLRTAKDSKNPYYSLEFTIDDDDAGDDSGRKMFRNYALTEKSLWAFKQVLTTLGADEEAFDDDTDVEEVLNDLMGAECMLTVVHNEYGDPPKITAQIDRVSPVGGF